MAVRNEPGYVQSEFGLVSATPPKGFIPGVSFTFKSLIEQKQLVYLLVQREIKARYKDSFLGVIWSLARPLVQLLIYFVAIGKFLGADRSIPQFAIFVFAGLTAWGLFSEVLSASTNSIVANTGLIKKVYLPREIFPIAASGSALFNFCVQFIVLIIATIALGQFPLDLSSLMVLPAILLLFSFAFALGLLFSAINVYFRDMEHLVEVMLLVLFWASPVVYSYKFVSQVLSGSLLEQLYLWNPISIGVMQFQKSMWVAGNEESWPSDLDMRLWILLGLSGIFILVAQRVFSRLEGNFAQEL